MTKAIGRLRKKYRDLPEQLLNTPQTMPLKRMRTPTRICQETAEKFCSAHARSSFRN